MKKPPTETKTKTARAPRPRPGDDRSDLSDSLEAYSKEDTIGFLVWDATRAFRTLFQKRVLGQGLTMGNWPFIRELWEHDGVTLGELAQRSRMRGPTCVAAVADLQSLGLVKRVENAQDKRKVNLFLTEAGREKYRRVLPEIRNMQAIAEEGLSAAELDVLRRSLRRVRDNLVKVGA